MTEWMLAAGSALWLGVLTSISPCPLATNIAAIAFVGRNKSAGRVLGTGACYTAGRMATYLALGVAVVGGVLAVPALSQWLQATMNRLLGPVLIVTGMILLEMVRLRIGNGGPGRWAQRLGERGDLLGALLLGALFALTFCPVSAALFFGSLIPLAVKAESRVLLPAIYGAGTALPVLGFGLLIALGVGTLGRAFDAVRRAEVWMRRLTGAVFIAIGIYYTLAYTLGVL